MIGVTKVKNKRIDVGVLRRFDHLEKIENDRIPKNVYERKCAGSQKDICQKCKY